MNKLAFSEDSEKSIWYIKYTLCIDEIWQPIMCEVSLKVLSHFWRIRGDSVAI